MNAGWRVFVLVLLALLGASSHATMTDKQYSLKFQGRSRDYIVSVPSLCVANCPVVFDLHGYLGSAKSERSSSGQYEKADLYGYIVVYPNGFQRSWNAGSGPYGTCCGTAQQKNLDDVGFIREVAARIKQTYPVDGARFYLTGLSNGCAMTQRLAAQASDIFAAAACNSLYLLTNETALPRAIPVTEIHAFKDEVIPYQANKDWTGAVDNLTRWAALNGCVGQPLRSYITAGSYVDTYAQCNAGVTVRLLSLAHSKHVTYENTDGVDIAQFVWDSLKDHRLP